MTPGRGLLTRRLLVSLSGSVAARVVQQLLDLGLVAAAAWLVAEAGPTLILAALVAAGVAKAIARYQEQYLGHDVAFRMLASLRVAVFNAARPLAPAALTDLSRGDLADRVMADVDRVEVFYAHTLAPVLSATVVPTLAVVAVAVWVDAGLSLLLAGGFLLAGLVVPLVGHRLGSGAAEEAASLSGAAAAHLVDGIQGLDEVVGFGYGEARLGEMEALAESVAAAELRAARLDGVRAFLFDLVAGLTLGATAWVGWEMLEEGAFGLPQLAAAVAVSLVGFSPLRDTQTVKRSYDRAMASADRLRQVMERRPVVTEPVDPESPAAVDGITFDEVRFTYPGSGEVALAGVSLAVRRGEKVAVVGSSGSGKTTLALLAVRFWDVDGGEILLGGVPLRRIPLARLRSLVTMVPQRPRLLFGTIADNIALGRRDAGPAEIERAARAAGIHEFVTTLPDGYDTGVGELGDALSGGQRQRIAVARAILSPAPVVVLDEATSDLDAASEGALVAELAEVLADRVVLVIAHRITTVVDADEIVVLERGRVVERGTHRQLLSRPDSFYRRLWDRQLDLLS